MAATFPIPEPTPAEWLRYRLGIQAARVKLPQIQLDDATLKRHLFRSFALYYGKPANSNSPSWTDFFQEWFTLDWLVAVGCAERQEQAWELLFEARTGRSDCLLVDALRARAFRLYPKDEVQREQAVAEFWSLLLVPTTSHGTALLERYDGKRPLAPWLIRVFQNWHLTKLRSSSQVLSLPDDDYSLPAAEQDLVQARWHQEFLEAGRLWLARLSDGEKLLLGLRWRYKLSQRDIATLFKVHEGTISRRTDKLRDHALDVIGQELTAQGWTGDDLAGFIATEMHNLLLEEPSLSAESLKAMLHQQGYGIPAEPSDI